MKSGLHYQGLGLMHGHCAVHTHTLESQSLAHGRQAGAVATAARSALRSEAFFETTRARAGKNETIVITRHTITAFVCVLLRQR